jgi:hypothetical protein
MIGFKLSGPWKIPNLGANGSKRRNIFDWGSMQKHLCLAVNGKTFLLSGQWKNKKHSSHLLSLFNPIVFFFNHVSFDFKVLFYHGSNHYFVSFLLSPSPITCIHMFWCAMSVTHSLPGWLKIEDFIWIHDVMYDHIPHVASHTSKWKIALKVTLNLTLS